MQTFAEDRFQKGILAAPDRILVATDLTDGDYLLPQVIAQAKAGNAHVTLVHAIVPVNLLPIEGGAISYADQEKIDEEVQLILLGLAAKIQSEGITCDVVAQHGFAADVVQEQIRTTNANRLIMGTHGRNKLAQFALGSVANELLRNINIPTLVLGPHAHGGGGHSLPRRVLHPISLLGDYKGAVGFAMDLAQAYHAELTLLHVLAPDAVEAINSERTFAWAHNALTALAPNGEDLVPPIYTRVACGNLVEEILKVASEIKADWIVLGVDPAFPFWPFRDSTAYKTIAAASCPVLTIRHEHSRAELEIGEEKILAAVVE